MKAKKSNGKRKQAARRDLPVSDARAKSARGGTLGSAFSNVLKSVGEATATMARKG